MQRLGFQSALHDTDGRPGEASDALVGHVDWSFTDRPDARLRDVVGARPDCASSDPTRAPSTPSSRSARSAAAAGSRRHVHSFEEALYVLEGELMLDLDGRVHRLVAGRLRAHPDRVRHALANVGAGPSAGSRSTRRSGWIRRERPTRHVLRATAAGPRPLGHRAARPPFGDPTLRWSATTTARRRRPRRSGSATRPVAARPAGMDTAILAYSGISVKMLVDRAFGADLLTMFTVDYEPGGAAQVARPSVRGGVLLPRRRDRGRARRRAATRSVPGDVAFAGVGSTHGFFNTGDGRVRWIETQAPQPPARHAYRWVDAWKRFEED